MPQDPFYKAHWKTIGEDRMTGYRNGFRWTDAVAEFYRSADIGPGQIVADFGCGPGHVAVELARRVGSGGTIHAIDINEAFLHQVRSNAEAAGFGERIVTHQSEGESLPLKTASLDRITARNTLMYVDDPVATLAEFRRVLRPDGLAHAVDADWHMMAAEPVERTLWRSFVDAASHACRHADMGRRLYAAFVGAGFEDVTVEVIVQPDTSGRLLGMIRNMAAYAEGSGRISTAECAEVVNAIEGAHGTSGYFVAVPQCAVTGRPA